MYKRITDFAIVAVALLIFPLSLSSQNSFSLSLDANSAAGDQAVTSVNVSPDQVVAIQIFGRDIQNANGISVRFEYDAGQVGYDSFDAGNVLPNAVVLPAESGTDPTFVQMSLGALGGQATSNTGLVGTIRFRTTAAFSGTRIRLVRGELGRGGQFESVTPNISVELQSGPATLTPDFDGDGMVGFTDFLQFAGVFGSSRGDGTYQARYDLDGDGAIGFSDFLIFTNDFGKSVTPSSGGGGGGGGGRPDLIVESPSVSDGTLTPRQSFTLRATVRNSGTGSSAATTLRYYRSSNATISTSDTEVGTDSVSGLSASVTSDESISLNAPSSAGTYYYGACVDNVSGESDTGNNCSDGVRVTVSSSGVLVGAIRRLTNHWADDYFPSWSPNGRYIAFTSFRDGNAEIYVIGSDGSNPRRLTNHWAEDLAPSWSPDGRHIAFQSSRDGNVEIYVMGSDGSNPRRLINHWAEDYSPSWSPDGRHIAFHSTRDGNPEIYVMGSDGSNPRRLTNHSADDGIASWSPDGRHIAFISFRDGNLEIYAMGSDGSNPRRLTNHSADDYFPSWSPNGRYIAFTSARDGNDEIYVMGTDGGNLRRLTNHRADDLFSSWSPDGRHIAFTSFRDGNAEIYVMELQGGGN